MHVADLGLRLPAWPCPRALPRLRNVIPNPRNVSMRRWVPSSGTPPLDRHPLPTQLPAEACAGVGRHSYITKFLYPTE